VSFRKPEVLAPAGDRDCLEAAVRAGADAVYFGLQGFNARARAANFDVASLSQTLRDLHEHGVRGYVALNTLVFDAELAACERTIVACAEAGVDALIVQDLGVARLARRIAPMVSLHASTQMTCTDAASVELARSLGAARVILARELSLADIAAIAAKTNAELEVFVHGALCIAYSGQCLTSEAIGGRSANRGACAQACRLPYELLVDGAVRDTGDRAYLLSPQDLESSALVPELVRLGIHSLKIEGRLKTPEYVAAVTALYRQAVDAAMGEALAPGERERELALETFTRGSGPGFFQGVDHQRLVEGSACDHRGLEVGTCQGVQRWSGRTFAAVALSRPIARGDGLLFEGVRASEGELGGRVWGIVRDDREVDRAEAAERVLVWLGPERPLSSAMAGRRVFRTSAPAAAARIRELPAYERPLDVRLVGSVGAYARLDAHTDDGRNASVETDSPLEPARTQPLTEARVRSQLERLGGSGFRLRKLSVEVPDGVILPVSSLNRARRALVEELKKAPAPPASAAALPATAPAAEPSPLPNPGLFVLCRTLPQARAALAAGADGVYLDFLELTGTGDALRALRAEGAAWVGVAPPRIRKPGEEKIDRYLHGLVPDAVLVRGLGALGEIASSPSADAPLYIGDFSLNVANQLTAREVLGRGLAAFTPSFDLDSAQLVELVAGELAARSEIVVHHPMPLFHMEHCVIAALLSGGRDYRSCGRPCDRHRVSLRDRAGMEHPVEADVGCRNTVFHAASQSAAELVPRLRSRGVERFRIELVRESEREVEVTVGCYRRLLANAASASDVRRELKATGEYGVVRGSLRVIAP
jgi:putative protease